jgi:hypothetical protein
MTTRYPTHAHTRGTTFSRAALVALPAGTWTPSAHIQTAAGQLIETLACNLAALAEPDSAGNTHTLSVLSSAAQAADWPLADLMWVTRFTDSSVDPVIVPAVTRVVKVSALTTPASESDNPLAAITDFFAPVLRGATGPAYPSEAAQAATEAARDAALAAQSDAEDAQTAAESAAATASAAALAAANSVADAADASRLTIGTVTTLDPGQAATAEIAGDAGEQVLNLGIPRGADGEGGEGGGGTIDATPTDGSSNAVSSNGVFDALAGKQPLATVLTNTTASFTSAQETKLGHISVTQAVDLDAIESRVNDLDAAVVLKGVWDASAGTFPGAGVAQAGWSYIVSVAGTVDGTAFAIGDRAIAITDNASTSTLAGNWFKADYTDQVLSVAGRTGAVTLTSADLTDTTSAGRALLDDATAADQRSTLGLGDAATKNTGTTAGTVAAGNDARLVRSVTILLPVTNDEITLFRASGAMTITKLVAVGGGFTYTVRKAADRSATGTEVVTGGSTVTSTTTGDTVTSFTSASIASGDYVWLKLTSVTGTPASFNLTMEF